MFFWLIILVSSLLDIFWFLFLIYQIKNKNNILCADAKPSVSQEEIPLQESFEEVKSAVTVREPLCSEESERDQLNRHIHVYVDEKHKCDVCNKSFNYAGDLIRHNRRHTGEKPYQCELCVRSFSHNSNLVRHKRIHTGEKLYKCHECNKSFSDSSHLVRHAYVHSNEKPYKCDLCNKFFSQKSNLVRHKCIHTDEKP